MIPRLFAAIAVMLYLVASHLPANAQRIRAASGGLSVIHSLLWAPYEQKLMKKYGLHTAFIHRPLERGAGKAAAVPPTDRYDFVATDMLELAKQLGV